MSKPVMTAALARSAGLDAGNRSARRASRTQWSPADVQAAGERQLRALIEAGILPALCYEASGYGPWVARPASR